MKILFISGREPSYARNNIILKGLRRNRVDVIDCSIESKHAFFRYSLGVLQFLVNIYLNYDIILVGFYGQPLVSFIRRFSKKPIILDAYMSGYQTLVFDKKKVKNSFIARLFWRWDKESCTIADKVILDTEEHCRYFEREFNLPKSKLKRVWIGADDEIFFPRLKKHSKNFIVEFHGGFIPLQGVDVIIKAAKLLENDPDILIKVIGGGQTYPYCRTLAKQLGVKNIIFLGRKANKEIPVCVAETDIGLGIFGSTHKAHMVIPNKAYEIIAMKIPLINGRTKAAEELFEHKKNAYLCKTADPKSLADAIIELKKDKTLRKKIAEGGYALFKKEATPAIIGKKIKDICEEVLREKE